MKNGKSALQLGCGLYGEKITRKLLGTGVFSRMVLADLDLNQAQSVAEKMADTGCHISACQVDATDRQALVDLFKGMDIIVNITGVYEYTAVPSIDAAIEAQVNYVDINSDINSTKKVLERDEAAKSKNVSALIGFGDTPGIINIFGRYAADQLDRVDKIHIAVGGGAGGHVAAGVERFFKRIASDPAIVFRGGNLIEVPACTEKEYVKFIAGVDEEYEVMLAKQPLVLTFPRVIRSINEVTFKIGFTPTALGNDIFCALRDWGMASEDLIDVKGVKVAAVDFASAFLASDAHINAVRLKEQPLHAGFYVKAIGSKNEKPATVTYRLRPVINTLTECTLTQAATLLAQGEIKEKGIVVPEAVDPKPFIEMAKREGVIIEELIEHTL